MPSSACCWGKMTVLFYKVRTWWHLEFWSSCVGQHSTHYDFPRVFLLNLKFMCLVFGGIYGNSFWSFTSYSIMLSLYAKLNQSFLELTELLECIGHYSVFQFLFLKHYSNQAFLPEIEKERRKSMSPTPLCHRPLNPHCLSCTVTQRHHGNHQSRPSSLRWCSFSVSC